MCAIDRPILASAFISSLVDFEDAVQIFGAVAQGLDAIFTRDNKGCLRSPIPVFSIQELLQQLGMQNMS